MERVTDFSLRALDLDWKAYFIEQELGCNPGSGSVRSRPVVAGRYVLQALVGEGQYGTVYLGIDNHLDREVAIKAVEPEELGEGRTLARVRHPNVVTVHETGVDGDVGFIVLEYVQGRSLEEWCRQPERSRSAKLRAFIGAGRGLAAVHESGLVHRDFKPKNVVMDGNGRAVLIDFGLAHPSSERIDDGRGSPKYMAPEIMTGRGSCPESDQFSFCVALWEALTGHDPFRCITTVDRFQSYVDGPAQPWRLPGPLGYVVRRGLSLVPSERWPSMDALLRALERCDYRRRAPAVIGACVCAASLAFGLLPLTPWARPAVGDPCDVPPASLALVAEKAAEDGRGADALALIEVAWQRAESREELLRLAESSDETGMRLFERRDYDRASQAHEIAATIYQGAGERDMAIRSGELARAALLARTL
jgi:serine/threonine protein kinase